jgi:adenosylcobinamide-phosphate synthase
MGCADAVGLALGYLLDLLVGDPRRGHPVAAFGRLATVLENRLYADRRSAGVTEVVILVGGAVGLGLAAQRATSGRPLARALVVALATWATLGGRSLRREAVTVSDQLRADDLKAARERIRHLVGRDPSELDEPQLARGCVESVAENTSDAVVAPLLFGALGGAPGLLGYRAVNTLDAMIGHRSARYRHYGWAAARLDDLANWLPARMTAVLTAALASLVGGSPAAAWRAAGRDAAAHPSPNAGMVEAAFAGALGVRLGGRNFYDGRAEDRGVLGEGAPPTPADIARAVRLCAAVSGTAAGLAVALRLAGGRALSLSNGASG